MASLVDGDGFGFVIEESVCADAADVLFMARAEHLIRSGRGDLEAVNVA